LSRNARMRFVAPLRGADFAHCMLQVPGWQWWPARLLPRPADADEGAREETAPPPAAAAAEPLVLFLVDHTVARVPPHPPRFAPHYSRFLPNTYANRVRSVCAAFCVLPSVFWARGHHAAAPAAHVSLARICCPHCCCCHVHDCRSFFRPWKRHAHCWRRPTCAPPMATAKPQQAVARTAALMAASSVPALQQ
jgi:hypothetical protein